MATFFKYKERDDISKSMIDWSGLTKQISDNLVEEKNRRDKTKFELEEDQLNKLKTVEEFTKGLDPDMNQKMMEMAQNYKDYLMQQHEMMKRGLISVNDTKLSKQGAMDTFNAINDVTKVYNEKMQTFIDKGGNVNEFIAESAARVLNIADSTLVIDPKTGRGSFVTTDESGNEIAIPATGFNNVLNDVYERFDTTAQITNAIKNAGTWVEAASAYSSVKDLRNNPEYKKWKEARINSMLSNDKLIVSAAADALGMKPTFDKELAKTDEYFLAENKGGKVVFDTKGIREKVAEKLDSEIEIAIDREVARSAPPRATSEELRAGRDARTEKETFNLITKALKGDSTALQSLANTYGFQSISDAGSGKFKIVDQNGTTRTIDTRGGIQNAGGTFASAIGLSAEKYINQVNDASEVSTDFSDNVGSVNYVQSAPENIVTSDNIGTIQNAVSTDKVESTRQGVKVTEALTDDEISQNVKNALNKVIGPMGYTASVAGDIVTVNGKELKARTNDVPGILREIQSMTNKPKAY